jgi:hypothetical protein
VLGRACGEARNRAGTNARIGLGSELEINTSFALASLQFSRMEAASSWSPISGIAITLRRVRLPSLRCRFFRERLGASRLRSLTLTAARP